MGIEFFRPKPKPTVESFPWNKLPDELKTLDLKGCERLGGLPTSMQAMIALRTLVLNNCWALKTLPDALGMLQLPHQLQAILAHGCKKLTAPVGVQFIR